LTTSTTNAEQEQKQKQKRIEHGVRATGQGVVAATVRLGHSATVSKK